jgi:aldose 1-epimerase
MADVVLGYDDLAGYRNDPAYFGAIAGRFANRIAGGRFTLDGKPYQLARNDGGRHHLHGGTRGFNKVVWRGEMINTDRGPSVELTYRSPDGEEGYPGTLTVMVVYTLTHEDELVTRITATTDKPTILNLTNHTYWNLAGQGRGDILEHELRIAADRYTPTRPDFIPVGRIDPVEGTAYDFRVAKSIGRDLMQIPANRDLGNPGGYDVNFVLNGEEDVLHPAATAYEPVSGRVLEVETTEPGMQFYSGNFLNRKIRGKRGAAYGIRTGFCLETQHFPDAVNHPDWPTVVLRPGETYQQKTVYRFSTR